MAKFEVGENITREVNNRAVTLTVLKVQKETYTLMNHLGQTEEFPISQIDRNFTKHTGGW